MRWPIDNFEAHVQRSSPIWPKEINCFPAIFGSEDCRILAYQKQEVHRLVSAPDNKAKQSTRTRMFCLAISQTRLLVEAFDRNPNLRRSIEGHGGASMLLSSKEQGNVFQEQRKIHINFAWSPLWTSSALKDLENSNVLKTDLEVYHFRTKCQYSWYVLLKPQTYQFMLGKMDW